MISKKNIQKQNLENLLEISHKIKNIEYFIFYGTLLGITRDNSIIKGDDDVDFMVSYNSKKLLLKKMS
ncbi:LicD family protein, partial [Candidatus Pelagibacter sp.]|nr:LicD family protein [Candidatus Pelagibacter sp.]